MAEHKLEKLAEWLRHMQQVNHPLRHIPEMAAHIEDLKDWERSINSVPGLIKTLEEIAAASPIPITLAKAALSTIEGRA